MQKGIRVSLWGTGIEAIGLTFDIMHHFSIGITSPEGLLTLNHTIIFVGFLINSTGVLMTLRAHRKI